MSKVAVIFWTQSGNTEQMAQAVADGAKNAGADVDLLETSDFSPASVSGYQGLAFGCPAMGDEQLEDSEFQPLWDSVKGNLIGKKVGIFGSYGWGDGEWMHSWKRNVKSSASRLHLTPSLRTKLLTTTPSRHAAHSVPLSSDSAYPLELTRKYSCDSLTRCLSSDSGYLPGYSPISSVLNFHQKYH